jgi:two-component system KDP operon response regulator KdpE
MEAPTVLVIEDDPQVARALRRALRVASLTCDIAGSAKEVREVAGTYDIAIVDVNLPDGNGIDLYDELRAAHRVGSGIFFTATENELDKARAAQFGTLISKSEGVQAAVSVAVRSLADG